MSTEQTTFNNRYPLITNSTGIISLISPYDSSCIDIFVDFEVWILGWMVGWLVGVLLSFLFFSSCCSLICSMIVDIIPAQYLFWIFISFCSVIHLLQLMFGIYPSHFRKCTFMYSRLSMRIDSLHYAICMTFISCVYLDIFRIQLQNLEFLGR